MPALLIACASAPAGHEPAGPHAARTAPLPDAGAIGLAAWVGETCEADGPTRAECREAAVVRIAEERGIGTAMAVIESLHASDREGHVLTHMVGIRGFRGAETVAESFAECTPIHQSGCYHGVIQAYFAELHHTDGAGAVTVDRLDAL